MRSRRRRKDRGEGATVRKEKDVEKRRLIKERREEERNKGTVRKGKSVEKRFTRLIKRRGEGGRK